MIKTAGGTFDQKNDPKPVYFLAGNAPDTAHAAPYSDHLLVAVNELLGPGQLKHLESVLDRPGKKVFLDSGIFALTNEHARKHRVSMDEALALSPEEIDGFEELYNRYVYLVRTYEDRLWGYIELDQGGAVNKRKTRAKLHSEGLKPIPVYHPLNDGFDYFDELAESHDRICLGNIVQANYKVRMRLLHTMFMRKQKYPHLWVHVLGLTQTELVWAYPFESCDSSAWLRTVRWSGWTERSCGRVIGSLPKNFQYRLGKNTGEDHTKCKNMGAVGCEIAAANLQYHVDRLKELGYDLGL